MLLFEAGYGPSSATRRQLPDPPAQRPGLTFSLGRLRVRDVHPGAGGPDLDPSDIHVENHHAGCDGRRHGVPVGGGHRSPSSSASAAFSRSVPRRNISAISALICCRRRISRSYHCSYRVRFRPYRVRPHPFRVGGRDTLGGRREKLLRDKGGQVGTRFGTHPCPKRAGHGSGHGCHSTSRAV